jgi:hypothetical protein
MFFIRIWRLLTRRERRVSFYESDIMREAVRKSDTHLMATMSDEVLQAIVANEPHTLRSEAAHHELETRAARTRSSMLNDEPPATTH